MNRTSVTYDIISSVYNMYNWTSRKGGGCRRSYLKKQWSRIFKLEKNRKPTLPRHLLNPKPN